VCVLTQKGKKRGGRGGDNNKEKSTKKVKIKINNTKKIHNSNNGNFKCSSFYTHPTHLSFLQKQRRKKGKHTKK
jgi:hypothetical protein